MTLVFTDPQQFSAQERSTSFGDGVTGKIRDIYEHNRNTQQISLNIKEDRQTDMQTLSDAENLKQEDTKEEEEENWYHGLWKRVDGIESCDFLLLDRDRLLQVKVSVQWKDKNSLKLLRVR